MPPITIDDLLTMPNSRRREIMFAAHPIDPAQLDNTMYRGVDLSLPVIMNKILWKTFRKTFHRDPATGVLRGWNVRMEQTGYGGPGIPKQKKGKQFAFGHYHLLPAGGINWPQGWKGENYLDYTVAGNPWYDVAGLGKCPLVCVNEGDHSLLLGWEIFTLGKTWVPLPDYWALIKEGPLDVIEPRPGK